MPTLKWTCYFLCFSFLVACQHTSTTETDPVTEADFFLDWEAIADKLQERMDIQPGERVILVGQPGPFDALVPLIRDRIARAQGEDLGVISVSDQAPEDWSTSFVAGAKGKTLEELVEYFQEVDLGIMLPGATPMDAPYGALQDVLRQGRGRTIHFHWSGAYDLNGELLPLDETINACYQKAEWEQKHNPAFNSIEFDGIRKRAGANNFFLSVKEWNEKTEAIGLKAPASPIIYK